DARVVDVDRPRGHRLEDLVDDLQGLAHLADADAVAAPGVAVLFRDDVELVVLVAGVRPGFADVVRHPGGPEHGAGEAEADRDVARDGADSLAAVREDPVAVENGLDLVDRLRALRHELPDL